MATKVNFYENYGDKSARERAELIYSNYSSFQGIIEDCKMRLIYEIKAEKERKRSNHKDELGVRIQNLGNYSNPTADEAVLDVMLEGAIKGLNSAEDALSDPALVQEFKRREYVIVMMADEYASFRRHLHALSVKEQEIIIPLLKQEKACSYAIERLNSLPLCNRLLREIHEELLSEGRGKEKNPGEFRRSQNWIGAANCTLNEARYIPPNVEDMNIALSDLEKYMNEGDEYPIIDIKKTASALGISFNTTSSAVNKLVEAGILKEKTNASRNRVFSYEEYLNILRKDT